MCGEKCGTECMFVFIWNGWNTEEVMADSKYKVNGDRKEAKQRNMRDCRRKATPGTSGTW